MKKNIGVGVLCAVLPAVTLFLLEETIKEKIENGDIDIPDAISIDTQVANENRSIFENKRKLGKLISLRRLHNKGVARGMLGEHPELVKSLSMILTMMAAGYAGKKLSSFKGDAAEIIGMLGTSALIGGSMSNTKDRLSRGYVVDYFSFEYGPQVLKDLVFNISDIAIIAGVIVASFLED